MSTWDEQIFTVDANTDFLDELVDLDFDEVFEAVRDAVLLAAKQDPSEDELLNGEAAATIAAIWAGAPFSASETVEDYPYIRDLVGTVDDTLTENALEILDTVEEDYDVEPFIEALS